MLTCDRVNHSEDRNELHAIIEYVSVTLQNAGMVRESVPADQIDEIEAGDEISVYAIYGFPKGPRRLTIWYNKEMAALETSAGSIRGDWDEDDDLLLTEELVEAQNADGAPVNGRIAYNLSGTKGIYSSGNFYHLTVPTDNCYGNWA